MDIEARIAELGAKIAAGTATAAEKAEYTALTQRMDRQTQRGARAAGAGQTGTRGAMSSPSPFKKGGSVKSSASRRADGIAQRGKTKGRFV